MNNADIQIIALRQLSKELNCSISDLLGTESKVVISKPGEYYNFCNMVCYRNTLVASVDEKIKEFMDSFVANKIGFRCFEAFGVLSKEFFKYNRFISIGERYLPDVTIDRKTNPDFDTVILRGGDIAALYDDKRFHMALSYKTTGLRADVLAVAGYKNNQILGVAGASNDYGTMWQVGIDVVPEHRNKGIAEILTKILTDEILKKGIVPFIGMAWSNIASINSAINSGYKLAWVEICASDD